MYFEIVVWCLRADHFHRLITWLALGDGIFYRGINQGADVLTSAKMDSCLCVLLVGKINHEVTVRCTNGGK